MKLTRFLISCAFIFICKILSAQNCYNATYSGEGTYYDSIAGTSSGNCSLPIAVDEYQYCAMNDLDYNNSEACDACIDVTGPNGSIILRVVDRCPECASGDVDMSEQAFSQIADVIDGRVDISWTYVECPLQDNIEIVVKEGSSMYHTEIQLRNLKHAVSTLEYLDDNNNWITMERQLYNFFVETNGINSPMTLRATSVLNEELIFENVNFGNTILQNNLTITTNQQFTTPEDCTTLSIESNTTKEHQFTYYPNPTKNRLFIKNNNENFWKNKTIIIRNLKGQILLKNLNLDNIQTQEIELNKLANGVYILNILDENKIYSTHRIILNKKTSA